MADRIDKLQMIADALRELHNQLLEISVKLEKLWEQIIRTQPEVTQ